MLKPGQKRINNDIPFMVTKQVKEMAAACHALIESREMGVVYGEPGVGKTISALHITAEWQKRGHPKALYTEVDVGSSPVGVAINLLRMMADIRPANASDALRIIENLTVERELVLIIMDEADRLNAP